jgi:oligoendopeptidase F
MSKYNENNRLKQKYYNMIIHYFDSRIRKQANKCLYQSVSKILHTLNNILINDIKKIRSSRTLFNYNVW